MSSITIRSARISRLIALLTESSARWRRINVASDSSVCQATVLPSSIAACPKASARWLLPVPDGPQMQRFSARAIHSSVRSACCVAAGIGDAAAFHASNVLPAGSPRRAATHPDRRAVAAGGLLGEQDAQHFGGIPALGLRRGEDLGGGVANVGHPQPPQQPVDLIGQRRGGRGLDGHPPKPSQERVERCSDCCSLARVGNAMTSPPWCARIAARSPSAKRPASAAARSASSTWPAPWSLARSTASASLRRTRVAPAAAAAISHASAPAPIRRNASSSALAARGLRSSAPAGRGG